jgi:ligand-binding sensor domain-containing protein/DNA-binding CsgD family transcriptional regulator
VLISFAIYAQELPPIVNYSPKDYEGGNQNWKIDQSDSNYIYVGNNSGLLEYNGANWKIYPSINHSIIRSVQVIGENIFTGCYMDFGFWKRNSFGNLTYTSLIEKLPKPLLDDESFWNIVHLDNYVLFQSLNRIYIYNLIDESFKIIDVISKRAVLFKVRNNVYFQESDKGIFKIENGKATLVSNELVFKNKVVVGVFLKNKKLLFLTEEGKFYFLENEKIIEWNIDASQILSSKSIYCSTMLSDDSFVLGTIADGIYHINADGELIQSINKEKGLLNNTVLSVFEDHDNNVWLGLDNGLNIINIDSPFKYFNDTKGKIGSVYSSIIFRDNLFIGTNQGLFFKPYNSNKELKFIKNTKGQVWCLKSFDNTLFCGHNEGTFVIENETAIKISEFSGTWDIKQFSGNPNLLLQGNYNGISVLEKTNGNWKFRNKVTGFDISSRYFEFISKNELLINHEYIGVFKLKVNPEFYTIDDLFKFDQFGVRSSLFAYRNKVYHASSNGLHKYNSSRNLFSKDTVLSNMLYKTSDPVKGNLIADNVNRLWGFSEKNIVYIKYDAFNTAKRIDIPVEKSFRSRISVSGFESLNHLKDEKYIIASTNGFTTLNIDKLTSNEYSIHITSLYKQELDAKKKQLPIHESPALSFTENNLYFEYSVPQFDKNLEIKYQHRLNGLSNNWSNWDYSSNVNYNNLTPGAYTFEVKALVGNTYSTNSVVYSFTINKPWYLTNVAYALYLVLLVLLGIFVHTIYKRYYTKQNKILLRKNRQEKALLELENTKAMIEFKNQTLQKGIESKAKELSIAAMSIIKKNELLTSIKKELQNIKMNAEVKTVIKKIEKNLSDNKDWQLFEEAINNVDTNFLKKLKEVHPNLTSNELRLCAYLRLNLSSKEIASLLNISPRSVDIKRYRLRKKINLPTKKGLVDYILEI